MCSEAAACGVGQAARAAAGVLMRWVVEQGLPGYRREGGGGDDAVGVGGEGIRGCTGMDRDVRSCAGTAWVEGVTGRGSGVRGRPGRVGGPGQRQRQ